MLTSRAGLDAEPRRICLRIHCSGPQGRFQFRLKFLHLLRPHHIKRQNTFTLTDVLSLDVEIRFACAFLSKMILETPDRSQVSSFGSSLPLRDGHHTNPPAARSSV